MRTEPSLDPATGDEPVTDAGADAPPRSRRRLRASVMLPWVLVVLAVALAVVATWRWQELAGEQRQREAVAAAAGDFTVALTNWDAAAGMGDTREALREGGTQAFAQDVDDLFGGTEDLAALTELGARSEGEVRDVFVQSIGTPAPDGEPEATADGEQPLQAEALAVVVQRLTTDDGQETNVRYARMVLEDVDGRWLVHEVELLVDATQQPAVPGGGA